MRTRKPSIVGLILLMLLPAMSMSAHSYEQVGGNSNFLVDEGKLFFAQADGTLTVLKLNTGEVIARKRNIYYEGSLQLIDEGILVMTHSKITLP